MSQHPSRLSELLRHVGGTWSRRPQATWAVPAAAALVVAGCGGTPDGARRATPGPTPLPVETSDATATRPPLPGASPDPGTSDASVPSGPRGQSSSSGDQEHDESPSAPARSPDDTGPSGSSPVRPVEEEDRDDGAPGAPVGPAGEEEALPSPVRIPLPADELMGSVVADRRAQLEEEITTACGGDRCIGITTVGAGEPDDGSEPCDTVREVEGVSYVGDELAPYVEVPRGGAMVLVVNVRCEDVPPPTTPSTAGTTEPGEPSGTVDSAPGSETGGTG